MAATEEEATEVAATDFLDVVFECLLDKVGENPPTMEQLTEPSRRVHAAEVTRESAPERMHELSTQKHQFVMQHNYVLRQASRMMDEMSTSSPVSNPDLLLRFLDSMFQTLAAMTSMSSILGGQLKAALHMIDALVATHPDAELAARVKASTEQAIVAFLVELFIKGDLLSPEARQRLVEMAAVKPKDDLAEETRPAKRQRGL
jgi:hypothetical protein